MGLIIDFYNKGTLIRPKNIENNIEMSEDEFKNFIIELNYIKIDTTKFNNNYKNYSSGIFIWREV